jgi:three-Cys-motif partner protein
MASRKSQTQSTPEDQLPFDLSVLDGPPGAVRAPVLDREERFFTSSRTPASQVKSKIAIDTFLGWAGVMLTQNPLALYYIDLYCGRGVYGDGTASTPLELFDKIVAHPRLPHVLHMIFNDRKAKFVLELRDRLIAHSKYGLMAWKPQFSHGEVSEDLVAALRTRRPPPPTFAFIDPFGYKGVTQELIHMILQDFGCDVLFFFPYHAIKRVLANPNDKLRGHLEALLGPDRVALLRERFRTVHDERDNERAVLRALAESMRAIDGRDVLSFAFRRRTGHASHHLVFVSKHVRGYQVAKEAMGRSSSWTFPDGIPSLEFITPGYDHRLEIDVDAPSIEKLKLLLVRRNGGQCMSVESAYDSVTLGTPYVQKNVREALVSLIRDHGAVLYSNGVPGRLRGSLLPAKPRVLIPTSLRRT